MSKRLFKINDRVKVIGHIESDKGVILVNTEGTVAENQKDGEILVSVTLDELCKKHGLTVYVDVIDMELLI